MLLNVVVVPYMKMPTHIQSTVDGNLGDFQFRVITKKGAMNIHVKVSVYTYVFHSLRPISRSGSARSYGNSMFNLLRNCQAVFQSGCTILHSHQQCMIVSKFSTSSPTSATICPFNLTHSGGCEVVACGFDLHFPDD